MLKKPIIFGALCCVVLYTLPSQAEPTDIVAIVNGEPLTQADLEDYVKSRAEQTRTNVSPDEKTLIEELVNRQLVVQDARKQKVDKDSQFVRKLQELRDNLMATMAVQKYIDKNPADDKALKSKYDEIITTIPLPKEYKTKHILVETEENAKAVIAALDEGKPFEELAKEKSTDASTASKGGDLGWITQQHVVADFASAMTTLEKGKYSKKPVKTEFGWHIIQIDDVRTSAPPAFESVKDKVAVIVRNQRLEDYVSTLRKDAKIEIVKKDAAEGKETDKKTEPATPAAKQ